MGATGRDDEMEQIMPKHTNQSRRAREIQRAEGISYTEALSRVVLENAVEGTPGTLPAVRIPLDVLHPQFLTNGSLENVGPYREPESWNYTYHLQQGFTASQEDNDGVWRDTGSFVASRTVESICFYCGGPIVMEDKGDPWFHDETGEEYCEGDGPGDLEHFAMPIEDQDMGRWYPLTVRESEYITESQLIGPFMMTYTAAVRRGETGRWVKCFVAVGELEYNDTDENPYGYPTRQEALDGANVWMKRLQPLVDELGGEFLWEEDGAPVEDGHLLEVYLPVDAVTAKYATADEYFTDFDKVVNTRLDDE